MIESHTPCYLYKKSQTYDSRIYHRVRPDNTKSGNEQWNTLNRDEAGFLTKSQWEERSSKWMYNQGWILESTTGESEVLNANRN